MQIETFGYHNTKHRLFVEFAMGEGRTLIETNFDLKKILCKQLVI